MDIRDGALRGITVGPGRRATYTLPCSPADPLPRALRPGHLRPCSTTGASPWRPSPSPWACASSTGSPTATPPNTSSTPDISGLPASTYKLSCHLPSGPGVPTPSASAPAERWWRPLSEAQRVVTNGMSEFARDKENINGGAAGERHPGGFRRRTTPWRVSPSSGALEAAAYQAGRGNYLAPAQRVEDFLVKRPSIRAGPGAFPVTAPALPGRTSGTACRTSWRRTIAEALPILGRKLKGYDQSRTRCSPPWRAAVLPRCVMLRNNDLPVLPFRGLYPCGEGGGWAGGILSAAADGMRCGEEICKLL